GGGRAREPDKVTAMGTETDSNAVRRQSRLPGGAFLTGRSTTLANTSEFGLYSQFALNDRSGIVPRRIVRKCLDPESNDVCFIRSAKRPNQEVVALQLSRHRSKPYRGASTLANDQTQPPPWRCEAAAGRPAG